MITVYSLQDSRIVCTQLESQEEIPDEAVWIDLQNPSEPELAKIQTSLGLEIPSKSEIWKNHILNRLYIENGVAFMTAALITKVESPYPCTSSVTFILSPKFLLTVHEIDPTSFRNLAKRIQKPGYLFTSPAYLFESLLEEMIMRVAYNSEVVVDALDELSHRIFAAEEQEEKKVKTPQLMTDILKRLGAVADLNSKINESLHSLNRMVVFFKEVLSDDVGLDKNLDVLLTDISVLTTQTSFLSDKVTFQLDATLGMINAEQNLIIKIFSVVAVFFLPPTLVTSLYGMNFHHMPELDLVFGYPIALFIMILSSLIPYLYFRKKGWL